MGACLDGGPAAKKFGREGRGNVAVLWPGSSALDPSQSRRVRRCAKGEWRPVELGSLIHATSVALARGGLGWILRS